MAVHPSCRCRPLPALGAGIVLLAGACRDTTAPSAPPSAVPPALAATAVCGAPALIACSAPGSGSSTQPRTKSASGISTDPAKAGKALGSLYGADAQKSFDDTWQQHIGFFVDYTQAGAKNTGVAQLIKAADGGIGYVYLSDAKDSGLAFAAPCLSR